jgi:hypothetical protein
MNYTQLEDVTLIKAWESVSLDAVSGNDQTGKRYWQRIEDKFFQFMPPLPTKMARTYRSLQGRWDVIKAACSRWSGCLEQVRNAPPSGTNESDWVSFFSHTCALFHIVAFDIVLHINIVLLFVGPNCKRKVQGHAIFQGQGICARALLEFASTKREMEVEGARSPTEKRCIRPIG